jgi:hypothetical protein
MNRPPLAGADFVDARGVTGIFLRLAVDEFQRNGVSIEDWMNFHLLQMADFLVGRHLKEAVIHQPLTLATNLLKFIRCEHQYYDSIGTKPMGRCRQLNPLGYHHR